jgi:hypothetical protein
MVFKSIRYIPRWSLHSSGGPVASNAKELKNRGQIFLNYTWGACTLCTLLFPTWDPNACGSLRGLQTSVLVVRMFVVAINLPRWRISFLLPHLPSKHVQLAVQTSRIHVVLKSNLYMLWIRAPSWGHTTICRCIYSEDVKDVSMFWHISPRNCQCPSGSVDINYLGWEFWEVWEQPWKQFTSEFGV